MLRGDVEWWIIAAVLSPYLLMILTRLAFSWRPTIAFAGSILYFCITVYLLIDTYVLNKDLKAILIFILLPFVQFGLIGLFLVANLLFANHPRQQSVLATSPLAQQRTTAQAQYRE